MQLLELSSISRLVAYLLIGRVCSAMFPLIGIFNDPFYDDRITVSPDGLNDEQDDETNLPHFGQLDISIGLIAV